MKYLNIEKEAEMFDIMEEEKKMTLSYIISLPSDENINSEEKYIKDSLKEQRYIFVLKNIIIGISNALNIAINIKGSFEDYGSFKDIELSKNIPALNKIEIEQTEFKKLLII